MDPGQLPVVSIDSLLNPELGAWTNEMVHINGFIVAYEPGQFLQVKDPTGSIRVHVVQVSRARQDDWVDVWGFLAVSPNETLLRDGYFESVRPAHRREGSGAERRAQPVTNQTITRIADVVKLSKEEAARGIPVRLRGVITFADAAWNNAFLQGPDDAVYVDLNAWAMCKWANGSRSLAGQPKAGSRRKWTMRPLKS